MPRTKKPVRRQEKVTEDDDNFKKLDRIVADQKKFIDKCVEREKKDMEMAFKIFIGSLLYQQNAHKTIGQLKAELKGQEEGTPNPTKQSSASHDDGYLTENSSQNSGEKGRKKHGIPVATTRTTGRRSRSADAACRNQMSTASKSVARRRLSRSTYRTPAPSYKNTAQMYPDITPKVVRNTPLTVLRQPRMGEMVVSMTGSPVMVPTYNNLQNDEMANCNIRLQDGTMLSLQPKQLRQSSTFIPFSLMDSNVISQLKTLKDNLDKVVKLGEKAMK